MFAADGLESELARLQPQRCANYDAAHLRRVGKRAFPPRDPNGITIQLADWNATTATVSRP